MLQLQNSELTEELTWAVREVCTLRREKNHWRCSKWLAQSEGLSTVLTCGIAAGDSPPQGLRAGCTKQASAAQQSVPADAGESHMATCTADPRDPTAMRYLPIELCLSPSNTAETSSLQWGSQSEPAGYIVSTSISGMPTLTLACAIWTSYAMSTPVPHAILKSTCVLERSQTWPLLC